jgi:hypothetical protein
MQYRLYHSLICTIRNVRGNVSILDFGCGEKGVARIILEGALEEDDSLFLYDREPARANRDLRVEVASRDQIFGPTRRPFDLISMSYVLCHNSSDEARSILVGLHGAQPGARLIIVDYVLYGRSRIDVMLKLNSDAERKWRRGLGEEEFYRMVTRFSLGSLSTMVRHAGYHIFGQPVPLDDDCMRVAIMTHAPACDG